MKVYSLIVCVALVGSFAGCADYGEQDEVASLEQDILSEDPGVRVRLNILRLITARFHNQDKAADAGFSLGINGGITHCVEHPTAGAMGFHWGNQERFDDPSINWFNPEVLVYAPTPDGGERLAAVEWVVHKPTWEAAGNVDPPVVLGQELEVINPALNWYILHAWIWKDNPAGTFEHWNPDVDCP